MKSKKTCHNQENQEKCPHPKLSPGPSVPVGLVTVCTVFLLLGSPVSLLWGVGPQWAVLGSHDVCNTSQDTKILRDTLQHEYSRSCSSV